MTDEDVRTLLRQLRDEPVPADSLARVRLAVAERSQAGTGIRRLWPAWVFAGALALVALVAVVFRPVQPTASRIAKPREAARPSAISPPPMVKAEGRKAAPSALAKRKVKDRPNATVNRDGLVVRIETADPDVVILLIGD